MSLLKKQHLPLMFLLIISAVWGYFYQSSIWLNDYGATKPEWLLLIDGFILLPALCFLCIEDKKEALIKALAYSGIIILLGSFVIPESSKVVWSYLEASRYLLLVLFLVCEVVTIATVIIAINASLNRGSDPDIAITQPIEGTLGKSVVADILAFEARVWTYFLFAKRINCTAFKGLKHFSYHHKDGTQSNLFGFMLLIVFELPIVHILLHFLWSPFAANVVSVLTLMSLVFFIAEYKAVAIRPVSLMNDKIIIRYGIVNAYEVKLSDIKSIDKNNVFIRRNRHIKRFNLAGNPNVKIELLSGNKVYLGLDNPDTFIESVNEIVKLQN